MKRLITFSPMAVVTFVAGVGIAAVAGYQALKPIVNDIPKEIPKKFDVYLERMEVRDSSPSRWNRDGGFLDIFDAVFFDDQTILALYLQDGMRISHDGGRSWQRMFEASGGLPEATGGFILWKLDFIDRLHGWAAGSCLLKTSDGGETWQNIRLPEWIDNLQVKFFDEELGYVAGRGGSCERGTGRCNLWLSVYKTTDGGTTWRRVLKTKEGDTPWQILTVDKDFAMVTFGGGWLYRTSDGGESWQAIMSTWSGRVMSVSRAPNGRLWMFGSCSVLVSDDLGATWKKPEGLDHGLIHHEWWSVDFSENGIGVAVSEDASIAITRDGGKSWKLAVSNLHDRGKIPVPYNPFTEALRGVSLNGSRGIVKGSQRDYWIAVPDGS